MSNEKIGGIYCIRCLNNNKRYIGSCENFKDRKRIHWNLLNKRKHKNKILQDDFNNYGEENFIFEILETVTEPELLEDLVNIENYYIENFKTYIPTYGNNFGYNQRKAMRLNKKQRENMSKSLRGHTFTDEQKDKIRESVTGKNRKHSIEQFELARELLLKGFNNTIVAMETGIPRTCINDFKKGKYWANKELNWDGIK